MSNPILVTVLLALALCLVAVAVQLRKLRKLERQQVRELDKKFRALGKTSKMLLRLTQKNEQHAQDLRSGVAHSASHSEWMRGMVLHQLRAEPEAHAVVSFPKTGSTTIYEAVSQMFAGKRIAAPSQIHVLHAQGRAVARHFEDIVSRTPGEPWNSSDSRRVHEWEYYNFSTAHAYRILLKERNCLPLDRSLLNHAVERRHISSPVINILIGVREPVANINSLLFQNVARSERWAGLTDETLLHYLRHPEEAPSFIPLSVDQPWPLLQQAWWSEQIEEFFGLDFLSLDFDRARGWHSYDFGAVRFMVIRMESFARLPEALGDFYDLPAPFIRVTTENVGSEKESSGERYKQFRSTVKLPTRVLDAAYTTPFAKHFYTDEEIATYRSRWAE